MTKFVSWRNISGFSACWVQGPRRFLVPGYCFAVVAIFLHCGLELSFAAQDKFKFLSGAFNLEYRGSELRENVHIPILGHGINALQFSENRTPESTGGSVEPRLVVNTVSDIKAQQGQNAGNDRAEVIDRKIAHVLVSQFFLGLLIALPILTMLFVSLWIVLGSDD